MQKNVKVTELSRKFEAYSILLSSFTDDILKIEDNNSDFKMELDTVEKFSDILRTLQNVVDNISLC